MPGGVFWVSALVGYLVGSLLCTLCQRAYARVLDRLGGESHD